MEKENIILKLSLEFSLLIITYCEELEASKKFVISNQLLKSGTSIGANIREAQNAESLNDFVHKFKIAAKEIDETKYWLELCQLSESYPNNEILMDKLINISKIVNKIISTSKSK
ncbi:four helix bundle protein [Faecalibacter bovis]|uniref:Four helix bundle protein n=1 Tax=Faecalibacter bovis TaxID=2898187 RepID=A0ABX7XGF4_9FLAO|nr:four helix bundle protein [Faecalibacter bovis]QTV07006.1 four helix bundle protein [Faecalibacter bovis]